MTERGYVELPAAGSPEANAALQGMLVALQEALRIALARRGDAQDDADLWGHLQGAYDHYDSYINIVTTAHPMQCRRGCRVCCSDNAHAIAGVELLWVERTLRAAGRVEALRPVFASRAAVFRPRRESLGLEGALATNRALGLPCPLLGEDGACTIYASRPLACRQFQSLTPAEWCDPADPRFADRENPNLLPPLPVLQLLGAISQCLGLGSSTTLWEGMDARLSGG